MTAAKETGEGEGVAVWVAPTVFQAVRMSKSKKRVKAGFLQKEEKENGRDKTQKYERENERGGRREREGKRWTRVFEEEKEFRADCASPKMTSLVDFLSVLSCCVLEDFFGFYFMKSGKDRITQKKERKKARKNKRLRPGGGGVSPCPSRRSSWISGTRT